MRGRWGSLRRSRRATSTSCRRSSTPSAAAGCDLPGRSLLPAAERGAPHRPGPRTSKRWARCSIVAGRRCPACWPAATSHRPADPRALRSRGRRGRTRNLAGRAPERDRTLAAALRAFNAPPPGDRRAEDPDAAARLRALGYVAGSAPPKARYTEADDPKQLVDLDRAVHDAVEAFGARRFDEAVRIYQGVIAKRPDMAIAYRHLAFVEWQRGNPAGRVSSLQRALGAGVTPDSDRRAACRLSRRHGTRCRIDPPARAHCPRSPARTPKR